MGTVVSSASTSLDGFVAGPHDEVEHLFGWYDDGDVVVGTADPALTFHLTPQSAEYWRAWTSGLGALVVGRVLFDLTDGWSGRHPLDVPVVVVTHRVPDDWVRAHPDAPFTFVTDGVAAAVDRAQTLARDATVGVAAGTIARQCLELGLLDEVAIDLVPVVLGEGKPYFGTLGVDAVVLGDPTMCVQGRRVTHLRFPVVRRGA
ncbi:dihydrofolate reductase family protein [Actinotalea solisilvae]|uniref:dihydrofolate reductase family protein n=1 Tax=Actinotalea solisilvae TaxID=2072922 RepID=UPI0018F2107B|nr:dihydrofolate reductase family protein [Actinotalea solisilvae]